MAGSYSHATTDAGNLRSNESFAGMIENIGDAYEMAEEMYGMIWWLASHAVEGHPTVMGGLTEGQGIVQYLVEQARQNYREGLEWAREENRRGRSEDAGDDSGGDS